MKLGSEITSLQNKKLKSTVLLRERKGRKATGKFIVEGAREIGRALLWKFEIEELFFCSQLLSKISKQLFEDQKSNAFVVGFEVDEKCFSKLAMRDGSDGLIAVFKQTQNRIEDLEITDSSLFLIVENIEKPGNLGAILRTADGVGVDAVIIAGNSVDLFNPNVIRSSVGSIFSVAVVDCSNNEILYERLKQNKISFFGAALSDRSSSYLESSYKNGSAIVLGSEADGLSDFWLEKCDHLIKIPMAGTADSLNVSVAGAVILYEAKRQRFLK